MPYTARVLAGSGASSAGRRFMRIEEEGELDAHVDTNYYWREHVRVHVPVVTSPEVRFRRRTRSTWRPANAGSSTRGGATACSTPPSARIHLVADTVGARGLGPHRTPARASRLGRSRPGPSRASITEVGQLTGGDVAVGAERTVAICPARPAVPTQPPAGSCDGLLRRPRTTGAACGPARRRARGLAAVPQLARAADARWSSVAATASSCSATT